jgi:hypothetical protein
MALLLVGRSNFGWEGIEKAMTAIWQGFNFLVFPFFAAQESALLSLLLKWGVA